MELVTPAAIAYWSALNHHGMTEQLPRTVFVATNHPVRRPRSRCWGQLQGLSRLRPAKFFGVTKDWIDEQPFQVTDKEKTIIDGLDLPQYVGGGMKSPRRSSETGPHSSEAKRAITPLRLATAPLPNVWAS